MYTSSFRTIILPALLASGTVFAALTLPGASAQADQAATQLPTWVRQWIAPSRVDQQTGVSIRYIGAAILSSTAVGIGTAEILRKRHLYQQRHQDLLKQALEEPPQTDGEPLWDGASMPSTAGKTTPLSTSARWDPGAEATLPSPAMAFPGDSPLDWAALNDGASSGLDRDAPAPIPSVTLLEEGNYPTRRIRTLDDQHLTAICVEGEFFSFYRRIHTLDSTHLWLDRLYRKGKQAVATPEPDGYTLWLHQPGAKPDLAAWQAGINLDEVFPPEPAYLAYENRS